MQNFHYYHSMIPKEIADSTLKYLKTEQKWNQVEYYSKKAQRKIVTPRFTYVYGYHYQNDTLPFKRKIPEQLRPIYLWVLKSFKQYFNFMLITKYSQPNHSISFHSDDETFLVKGSSIISTIFADQNVQRDFQMKCKQTKKINTYSLSHSDVFEMSYESQRTHMHSVPKRKNINGTRYGITFRNANEQAIYNYYKYN